MSLCNWLFNLIFHIIALCDAEGKTALPNMEILLSATVTLDKPDDSIITVTPDPFGPLTRDSCLSPRRGGSAGVIAFATIAPRLRNDLPVFLEWLHLWHF